MTVNGAEGYNRAMREPPPPVGKRPPPPTDFPTRAGWSRGRRLTLLLVIGGLGCVAAWSFRHFHLALAVGHGPAGPAVAAEEFLAPISWRPVYLLGMGDGVTEGAGVSRDEGYFFRLAEPIQGDSADLRGISLRSLFPRLRSFNRAVEGTSSIEHLEKQVQKFPVQKEEILGIVVLTTGAGDVFREYGREAPRDGAICGATLAQALPWVQAFEARLDQIVTALIARFPGGCHIFLGTILDATDGTGDLERIGLPEWEDGMELFRRYNRAIRRCAERHEQVHLVELHDAFLGHGVHSAKFWHAHYRPEDPHCWFQDDLELPNRRGTDAIRRLFLLEIRRALGGK